MTSTNKLWAIAVLLVFGSLGASVMFGQVLWTESGVSLIEGLGKFAQLLMDRLGNFLAGVAIWCVGICVAMACLLSGEGSSDIGVD